MKSMKRIFLDRLTYATNGCPFHSLRRFLMLVVKTLSERFVSLNANEHSSYTLLFCVIKTVRSVNQYLLLLNLMLIALRKSEYCHSSFVVAISNHAEEICPVLKETANVTCVKEIEKSLVGVPPHMSTYGKLLYESTCKVLKGRTVMKRVLLLFENVLLLLKIENQEYKYIRIILRLMILLCKKTPFKVYSRAKKQMYRIDIYIYPIQRSLKK